MPNPRQQLRLQTAARSPLLQELMAKRVHQPAQSFQGMHPLAAALSGVTKGLEMRALRKVESERQKSENQAATALMKAISGDEVTLFTPPSPDEFKLGPDDGQVTMGQPPGDQSAILRAMLNPALTQQGAGVGEFAQKQISSQTELTQAKELAAFKANLKGPGKEILAIQQQRGKLLAAGFDPKSKVVQELDGRIKKLNAITGTTAHDPSTDFPVGSFKTGKELGLPQTHHHQLFQKKETGWIEMPKESFFDIAKKSQIRVAKARWDNVLPQLFLADENGDLQFRRLRRGAQQLTGNKFFGGPQVIADALGAVDAFNRAVSGAAVPVKETQDGFKMFMPSVFDDNETALIKFNHLKDFFDGVWNELVPQDASQDEKDAAGRQMTKNAQDALITKLIPKTPDIQALEAMLPSVVGTNPEAELLIRERISELTNASN